MAQLVEHILGKDEVPSSNLGSSSKNLKHFEKEVLFLVFGNEAHRRCMKNEAAFGYEALIRNMKNEKCALRFTAQTRRFIEAARLLLHIREANASFQKMVLY